MSHIFGIGLNKTGSSSLHHAIQILGYNSIHYEHNGDILSDIVLSNLSKKQRAFYNIEDFDCYFDYLPWTSSREDFSFNHLYKTLDKQYPNSLFIYNTRNIDSWLKSRHDHIARVTDDDLDKLSKMYPNNIYFNRDKEAWIEEYLDLDSRIKEYFCDRPNDLLIIDVCAGDGWDKLCNFLNKPIPDSPFPWINKAS